MLIYFHRVAWMLDEDENPVSGFSLAWESSDWKLYKSFSLQTNNSDIHLGIKESLLHLYHFSLWSKEYKLHWRKGVKMMQCEFIQV